MMLLKWSSTIFLLLLFYFDLNAQNAVQPADSAADKATISGFVATSFMLNKNWNEISNSSILLSANMKYKNRSGDNIKTITEINAEIGYIRFIDSIWVKNNDRFYFSTIWQLDKRKIRQTLSINFTTQMTDTWIETENLHGNERTWQSGPLVPATIISGYGFIYKFSSGNYFNLSVPAYKIGSIQADSYYADDMNFIKRTGHYVIYQKYGAQLVINVSQKFAHKFLFEHNSLFFIEYTLQKNFTLDVRNTLSFFPIKNFKLRIENKILYDKTVSESLQYKYEFLLGLNVLI